MGAHHLAAGRPLGTGDTRLVGRIGGEVDLRPVRFLSAVGLRAEA